MFLVMMRYMFLDSLTKWTNLAFLTRSSAKDFGLIVDSWKDNWTAISSVVNNCFFFVPYLYCVIYYYIHIFIYLLLVN